MLMDGSFILEVDGVDDSMVILLFLEVIWRGKNLVSICCLSYRIFPRADCNFFLLRQSILLMNLYLNLQIRLYRLRTIWMVRVKYLYHAVGGYRLHESSLGVVGSHFCCRLDLPLGSYYSNVSIQLGVLLSLV